MSSRVFALAALLAVAGCSASPAGTVHQAFRQDGTAPHSAIQSRAQIVAAREYCVTMRHGTSRAAAVASAQTVFGSKAKAATFISAAISAYCPDVAR